MKKIVLVSVLIIALFVIPAGLLNKKQPIDGNQNYESKEESKVSKDLDLGPIGDKGIMIEDLDSYNNSIVLDGNISDWAGIPHAEFNDVEIYLAYNDSFVFATAVWEDTSYDDQISHWYNTGNINNTHSIWDELDGKDDVLVVGFSNDTYSDIWIVASSLRGDTNYAYEVDGIGNPDAGSLPYMRNIDPLVPNQPKYYNNSAPISDHYDILYGTTLVGWFDDTPTGSQTDVNIAYSWNASGENKYIVEFRRLLDTGSYADDIKLDFDDLSNRSFLFGVEDKQDSTNFDVYTKQYTFTDTNEPAAFEFDIIPSNVTQALLITGELWDDFSEIDILVHLSGWDETYGLGIWGRVDVNLFTGDWAYLFHYNEDDMPLGTHQITILFTPKYEEEIRRNQEIHIKDFEAPQVLGIVDLNERYPCGVPYGTVNVPVIVGIRDNYYLWCEEAGKYFSTENLTAYLHYQKDNGSIFILPMYQFSTGGSTFVQNITIGPIIDVENNPTNNYSYCVQVFDSQGNLGISETHWFLVGSMILCSPLGPNNLFEILMASLISGGVLSIVVTVVVVKAIRNNIRAKKMK